MTSTVLYTVYLTHPLPHFTPIILRNTDKERLVQFRIENFHWDDLKYKFWIFFTQAIRFLPFSSALCDVLRVGGVFTLRFFLSLVIRTDLLVNTVSEKIQRRQEQRVRQERNFWKFLRDVLPHYRRFYFYDHVQLLGSPGFSGCKFNVLSQNMKCIIVR